jgi:large subunit ribosomal protein L5
MAQDKDKDPDKEHASKVLRENQEKQAAASKAKQEGKAKQEAKAKAKEEKGKSKDKDVPDEPVDKTPPRLREKYEKEVRTRLKERFKIENDMAVPRLSKIVINMGVNGAVENKSRVDTAVKELSTITGQRPTVRNAKKAISGFKLREGMPIACAVTLRERRMWEFADRLISIVLPRIRDFRGVKDKLDGRGNYTLGLSEQSVFPEIDFDKIEFTQGMDITFVTTAGTDERGFALLKELGMPFQVREAKPVRAKTAAAS